MYGETPRHIGMHVETESHLLGRNRVHSHKTTQTHTHVLYILHIKIQGFKRWNFEVNCYLFYTNSILKFVKFDVSKNAEDRSGISVVVSGRSRYHVLPVGARLIYDLFGRSETLLTLPGLLSSLEVSILVRQRLAFRGIRPT